MCLTETKLILTVLGTTGRTPMEEETKTLPRCQELLLFFHLPFQTQTHGLSLMEMPACFERQHSGPLTFQPHSKQPSPPSRLMLPLQLDAHSLQTPPPISHKVTLKQNIGYIFKQVRLCGEYRLCTSEKVKHFPKPRLY